MVAKQTFPTRKQRRTCQTGRRRVPLPSLAAASGTRLRVRLRPAELCSPRLALELLPRKAVRTSPRHTQPVEREAPAHPSARNQLTDMTPGQKQLQIPWQDSSSDPGTQITGV